MAKHVFLHPNCINCNNARQTPQLSPPHQKILFQMDGAGSRHFTVAITLTISLRDP